MDEIRARRMVNELIGKKVGECKITHYINCGKSALVCKGKYHEKECAIKVFDPELVERFGKEVQLQRIQRELSIKDNGCKHLVRIMDGGECEHTGLLYVVMEYLELPTLESAIEFIPRDNIHRILSHVAYASHHLELLGLSHRDIKPSNIVITKDYQEAILLDLGVLKLIGNCDITDDEAMDFIGTLRYSSPEFLLRKEVDTVEGWRAITFYQLGAVLHDLIMKKPLFDEYSSPYAQLVNAVINKIPVVEADDVSAELINLAKACLIKDPILRLKTVSWDSFVPVERSDQTLEAVKLRVQQRNIVSKADEPYTTIPKSDDQKRRYDQVVNNLLDSIERIIRLKCTGNADFPPVQISIKRNQIEIVFPSLFAHKTSSFLFLVLNIDVLDVETKAINMSYWSGVCSEEVRLNQINKKFFTLYVGIYQEVIIKDILDKFLYMSFDKGQQINTNNSNELVLLGVYEEIGGSL